MLGKDKCPLFMGREGSGPQSGLLPLGWHAQAGGGLSMESRIAEHNTGLKPCEDGFREGFSEEAAQGSCGS